MKEMEDNKMKNEEVEGKGETNTKKKMKEKAKKKKRKKNRKRRLTTRCVGATKMELDAELTDRRAMHRHLLRPIPHVTGPSQLKAAARADSVRLSTAIAELETV